jgi:hypothetical protein
MNGSGWTNAITKAVWTVLFAAVGVFIAWQFLKQVLPAVLVVGVLLLIYRVVIGAWLRKP